MKKRSQTPTPEKDWQTQFLDELSRTGNVSASAEFAGITRDSAYTARNPDKFTESAAKAKAEVFAQAWQEALDIAVEAMELEARRRAYEGWLEPVFYQGAECGAVRKFSDTLMIFLLKAHRPEKYRERGQLELVGKGGGPLKTYVTVSPDDWDEPAGDA